MTFLPIGTAVRYLLIALAAHLATKGYIEQPVADALVSAGVALSAIVWFKMTGKRAKRADYDPDYSSEK